MAGHAHQGRPSHTGLGRALMTGGALAPDWLPAFTEVPRSAFLPELMWPFAMEAGRSVPVSRSGDPESWLAYADADV
ncbi:protein-L-isoaspartate(D-aspartate) O-methyltransferase, partial [Streptomyces sp. CAI-78]|nr:protein-L-isoaspartate(D-aspartate) O-methyltransferase [Streptomyces sp. CAI-78]